MTPKLKREVLETIRAAHDVLATVDWWTQGTMARDADDEHIWFKNKSASSFCATAAVDLAAPQKKVADLALRAILLAMPRRGVMTLPGFNDRSTLPEVLALFRKAYEQLENA